MKMNKILRFYEKYTIVFIVLALPLGVMLASIAPGVMCFANTIINNLIDIILLMAPLAIFIVVAPHFADIIKGAAHSGFTVFVFAWFCVLRIIAAVWACIFTFFVLGLPVLGGNNSTSSMKILFYENLTVIKDLLIKSPYFWAIWIAIIAGIVSLRNRKLYSILHKGIHHLESFGSRLEYFIPFLMFLFGSYLYFLPQNLNGSLSSGTSSFISTNGFGNIGLLWFNININSKFGLLWVYLLGSILIGIGCTLWQLMEAMALKRYVPNPFSFRSFLKKYWIKVYPLAWSTSSEVISMPVSMNRMKKEYPNIDSGVRRLVIGLGSYLNVNGTTMHVILLAGIVGVLVGSPPSLVQLLLAIPVIVLIGFGIPGMPGELVIFALPIVKLLGLPAPCIPVFMALYIALQVGLPDSFRTGANVTDNGLYTIAINRVFHKKFNREGGLKDA